MEGEGAGEGGAAGRLGATRAVSPGGAPCFVVLPPIPLALALLRLSLLRSRTSSARGLAGTGLDDMSLATAAGAGRRGWCECFGGERWWWWWGGGGERIGRPARGVGARLWHALSTKLCSPDARLGGRPSLSWGGARRPGRERRRGGSRRNRRRCPPPPAVDDFSLSRVASLSPIYLDRPGPARGARQTGGGSRTGDRGGAEEHGT